MSATPPSEPAAGTSTGRGLSRALEALASPFMLLPERPWQVGMASFAGGLALAEARPVAIVLVAAGVAALLAGLGAARLAAVAVALLVVGVAVGNARLQAADSGGDRIRDGDRVGVKSFLLTPPRSTPFGEYAEVAVHGGRLDGARLLARAARWSPFRRGLAVGAELQLEGRLSTLRPRAPRGRSREPPFDYAAYLRRRGVVGELFVDEARATGRHRGGIAGTLDRMRRRAEQAVVAGLPEADAALLRGMVLGQDEEVDETMREDWRDAGLAHLLAVSGQNVMLLAALALPLLMLTGLGLRARFVVLAALILLYVPLAGAGPSLQRAGVMGLAGIVAMAASRPASRSYALLLAAAVTLAWNPRAWADPGWQLSFAAVAGILVLGVPLQTLLRQGVAALGHREDPRPARGAARAGAASPGTGPPAVAGPAVARFGTACLRGLADGLAITLAATIATAPLLGHHFGSVPMAGLPANLLALPAVAPAMWLGMLKAALGQFAMAGVPSPFSDVATVVATALGVVAALPLGYLARLAELWADVPGGQVALPLGSVGAVAGAYAPVAALALAIRGEVHGTRLTAWAARWRGLPRGRRRAITATLVAATVVALALWVAPRGPPGQLTIHFLDVGQGDATLIQHPDGTAVLFDGGAPEAGVVRLLRRAGVNRLALLVATHASRDHHGGLATVVGRFPVDVMLDGGDGTADSSFRALERAADERGIDRLPATAPQALSLAGGDLRVRVLSPPPRPPGPPPEDPNPRAVVAVVSSRGFDLLLSADAESEALLPLELPDVDAMKVPHHGSSDPGLPEALARLDPELAAIEVGPNTYGHPAPSTLAALRRAGVPTYRTDRDGTVTVSVADGAMRVEAER